MKKFPFLFVSILFAISIHAAEMTPDQILDRALDALGGKIKLKSLQTRESIGKAEVAGLQGTYQLRMKSPDHMRLDLDLGVVKVARAFDGKEGWVQQAAVSEQEGADLQRIKRSAILEESF
jgi:hypothetical protein